MFRKFALSALAIALAGCAAAPSSLTLTPRVATSTSTYESLAVPPASAFKTFTVKVSKILPDDNQGLTHQNFVVVANDGLTYDVNNSTTHGQKVEGLKIGLSLTIKGTVYKDSKKQGIHWTHHANKPGDAGWIKTPDGKIFE